MNRNYVNDRINKEYSTMSKGQKLLANYLGDHFDQAAFLTAAELGQAVDVSESTVVRFATKLGYKGYPEFQQALVELVRGKLDNMSDDAVTPARMSKSEVLTNVLSTDAARIKETLDALDENVFQSAVDALLAAKRIYVIGIRSCAPLASYLTFHLQQMFDEVTLVSTSNSSEIFEQMYGINEKDLLFAISFPRYSMRTLKACEFAADRRARIITLTDSVYSPLNMYSSCNLIAKSNMTAMVESLTAPMSVINALAVALCMKRQSKMTKRMEDMEKIWNDYVVYNQDEMNDLDDRMYLKLEKEN